LDDVFDPVRFVCVLVGDLFNWLAVVHLVNPIKRLVVEHDMADIEPHIIEEDVKSNTNALRQPLWDAARCWK